MILSDLHRRISSAFLAIKAEESFDEVFKDRKLLNLVVAYTYATDSAFVFHECAEKFLRKAKDDERIVGEALRGGLGKEPSVSALGKALNFESCFNDKPFMEEFIRKRNDFREQVSNLERLIERLMDSPFSIGKWVSRVLYKAYVHPRRNYARQRRCEILSQMNADVSAFRFCSKRVFERIHRMSVRVDFAAMELLEGEGSQQKIKIEDLEQWMNALEELVQVRRHAVYDRILEFLGDASVKRDA